MFDEWTRVNSGSQLLLLSIRLLKVFWPAAGLLTQKVIVQMKL